MQKFSELFPLLCIQISLSLQRLCKKCHRIVRWQPKISGQSLELKKAILDIRSQVHDVVTIWSK